MYKDHLSHTHTAKAMTIPANWIKVYSLFFALCISHVSM